METAEIAPRVDWEIGWQELRREPERRSPDPLLVAAGALAVGILAAKLGDWRAQAPPRR